MSIPYKSFLRFLEKSSEKTLIFFSALLDIRMTWPDILQSQKITTQQTNHNNTTIYGGKNHDKEYHF